MSQEEIQEGLELLGLNGKTVDPSIPPYEMPDVLDREVTDDVYIIRLSNNTGGNRVRKD